jgi:hypothetical protein
MTFKEELKEMQWQYIDTIIFYKELMCALITFKSGNQINADAPNVASWVDFVAVASLKLPEDKISYE